MGLAARGTREVASGGTIRIDDADERRRLRERAAVLWVRAGLGAAILTVVATGLLLLR